MQASDDKAKMASADRDCSSAPLFHGLQMGRRVVTSDSVCVSCVVGVVACYMNACEYFHVKVCVVVLKLFDNTIFLYYLGNISGFINFTNHVQQMIKAITLAFLNVALFRFSNF